MNIVDDIASGNSLFKAEVLRTQYIFETVKQCNHKQHCFIVMDEIFNGTTPNEGQAAAYSYAKCIGSYSNTMCLIATHFSRLTELEEKTDYYQNYKVSVNYKENGDIGYTFKLKPGISDQHIALDILRTEGFDNEILNNAKLFLS